MCFTGSQKNRRSKRQRVLRGSLAQEEDVTNEMRLIGCKMVQEACKRKSHDPNFGGKWRLEPFFADSSQMALVSLIWH